MLEEAVETRYHRRPWHSADEIFELLLASVNLTFEWPHGCVNLGMASECPWADANVEAIQAVLMS